MQKEMHLLSYANCANNSKITQIMRKYIFRIEFPFLMIITEMVIMMLMMIALIIVFIVHIRY